MSMQISQRAKIIDGGALTLLAILGIFYFSQTASNDRDWALDQQLLPVIQFNNDQVTIENIRNFEYTSTSTYTPRYYTKTFSLGEIQTVDYILEPFEGVGAAHTFLSFGFSDGSYISISVEIRKEKGESFSPFKGLMRQYELMYVIADERDVVNLRANHRKDTVYLYPTNATPEQAAQLFVHMLTQAQNISQKPEFYNTLTSNCTTNIVGHINSLRDDPIGWNYRMLFPKYSDVLAQELGFIAQGMTIEEARERYVINQKAALYKDDPEFSKKIRE
jgi:hypothetical protein